MGIDEGHAVACGVAAQHAGLAQRQRLETRQEFALHIACDIVETLWIDVERWMHVEAATATGAGRAVEQCGVGVGHEDHVRHVADQRLQCTAQLVEGLRQIVGQGLAGIFDRSQHAAAFENLPFGWAVDDDVGNESGKIDVVGADRQQHEIELAFRLAALCRRQRLAQLGELRVDLALTIHTGFRHQAFASALRAEQAVGDGRAGAGQRQVRYGDVRVLHGEGDRGAGLIAVQRPMAGRIEPHRAFALPHLYLSRRTAGAAAFVAGAARTEILAAGTAEIGLKAEANIGERDLPIRIAFSCGNGIAKAGDENVAHPDFGGDMLRCFGAARHIDGDVRRHAVQHTQIDRLGAIQRRLARTLTVVEGPRAGRADRNGSSQPHRHRMIDRRQIAFLGVVAGTRFTNAPGTIDAEPIDGIAGPAATVALHGKCVLCGQNAAIA